MGTLFSIQSMVSGGSRTTFLFIILCQWSTRYHLAGFAKTYQLTSFPIAWRRLAYSNSALFPPLILLYWPTIKVILIFLEGGGRMSLIPFFNNNSHKSKFWEMTIKKLFDFDFIRGCFLFSGSSTKQSGMRSLSFPLPNCVIARDFRLLSRDRSKRSRCPWQRK